MMRRVIAAMVVAALAAAVWATAGSGAGAPGTSVTISNEQGTTWTCSFNPFNPSVEFLSFGPVYEDLVFQNLLKSGAATPWLASSYTWGNGNKTLTFTMRPGVKWSDGKPLTAADVVFTFQLIKKYPALDLNSAWSVLSSVVQKGSNQAVFTFKTAAVPYFYYIAGQTPIVPQHVWASIKDPVTYKDPKPIGTGGFEMSSCSPQVIKYTKNASYWQKGLPDRKSVV